MKHLICAVILILGLGCFALPSKKVEKSQAKVAAVETKLRKIDDETHSKAMNYVFGADVALKLDPSPNRFSDVAMQFTGRSLLTGGLPEMSEANELRKIVENLVSTNEALIKRGKDELAKKDKEIVELQEDRAALEGKLIKVENERDQLSKKVAADANVWVKIKRIFYWIVGLIVFGIVIHILSFIVPPPYNSIFSIVSMILGVFGKAAIKIAPKAADYAGIVSRKAYDVSTETLKDIVASVEETKQKNPAVFDASLRPLLERYTNDETRDKIREIKKAIKH